VLVHEAGVSGGLVSVFTTERCAYNRDVPDPDFDIVAVARRQHGAFSRQQAHAVGLTDDRLTARVRQGWLERIGPNAFRFPGTDLTPQAQLIGLMIDVGEPCWAYGPTAAALHRFDGFELAVPFHLVIPRGRQVRRVGVVIHTSEYLPATDQTEIDGIPTLRATRTLLDLARLVDREALTRACDSAFRDGRVHEDQLRRRIHVLGERASSRLGMEALLLVLDGSERGRGGHSYLEREFLRLLDDHGLPRPETQQVLGRTGGRLIRVDFRFPGTNVVVEVLGYRYHRSREQMAIDAARMNALVADGYAPYQFTYEQVIERSHNVVTTMRRVLGPSVA
jgi:very-short-patch-repair endonuclease